MSMIADTIARAIRRAPGNFTVQEVADLAEMMLTTELQRLKTELQNIITAEETEIELLQQATGRAAELAIVIRSDVVTRLKKALDQADGSTPDRAIAGVSDAASNAAPALGAAFGKA